jgi:hypothetical protein
MAYDYSVLDGIIAAHDAYNDSLPAGDGSDCQAELAELQKYQCFGGHLPNPTAEEVERRHRQTKRDVYAIEKRLKGNNR